MCKFLYSCICSSDLFHLLYSCSVARSFPAGGSRCPSLGFNDSPPPLGSGTLSPCTVISIGKGGWSFFCVRAIEMRTPLETPPLSCGLHWRGHALPLTNKGLLQKRVGSGGCSRHMVDYLISASPPPTPPLSSGLILHTGGHCLNAKATSCVFAFTQLPPVQPFSSFSLQSCSFFVFLVNEHSVFWLTVRPFSLLGFNSVFAISMKRWLSAAGYCTRSFLFIFVNYQEKITSVDRLIVL